MSRLPTVNYMMSSQLHHPQQKNLSQSEYITSKNIPSQMLAKRCEQDEPIRCMMISEKPNQFKRDNETTARKAPQSQERRRQVNLSPTPTYQRSNIVRSDNVNLIEMYEGRISQMTQETQVHQNQLFTEQQRNLKMLNDYEVQVKNLELSTQSEKKTIEQYKLLIVTKNDELRLAHRDMDQYERKYQDQQNMILLMSQEIDRLKSLLDDHNNEMDGWMGQYVEREKNHLKEINRYKTETEYNQHLESQIKETNKDEVVRLEEMIKLHRFKELELNEKAELANQEMNALHRQLHECQLEMIGDSNLYQREIDSVKSSLHEQLDEMNSKKQKYQSEKITMETQHRHKVNEMETKLTTYSQEQQRLTDKLKEKSEEFESQRKKYSSQELDHARSSNLLEQCRKEQDHSLKQFEFETMQNNIVLQNCRQLLQITEDKFMCLQEENMKLNQIIQDYQIANEQWRQSTNQQYKEQIENFQRREHQDKLQCDDQVQQLTQQRDYLQDQINHLTMEHEQSKQQHSRTQSDLDNMKLKYSNLDQLRQSELSDYTQDFESTRQQLKDQLSSMHTEKLVLENTTKHLKQRISEQETQRIQLQYSVDQSKLNLDEVNRVKDGQIMKLNQDRTNLEQQMKLTKEKLQVSDNERMSLQETLNRQEISIQTMQEQNESDRALLVQQRINLEQQIRGYKQTINQYELQMNTMKQTLEQVEESLRQVKKELIQEKESFKSMQYTLTQEIITIKKQIEEYIKSTTQKDSDHQDSQEEIKRLLKQIKIMKEQQTQHEEIEQELSDEIDELQRQIEYFQKLQLDQKDWEIKFNAERTSLETQISQIKMRYDEELMRTETQVQEVRRLEDILHQKLKEIDHLRHQLGTNKLTDEEYEQLQKKMAQMHDQIYDMEQGKLKMNNEKATQEKLILRLQNDVQLKETEVEQVYELMNKRRQEQDQQIKDMDGLKKENLRQAALIQDQDATIEGLKDQIEVLKREHHDLNQTNLQLKRQVESMEEQSTLKHKQMMDKIHELDGLKAKYEDQWKSGAQTINTSARQSIMRTMSIPLEEIHEEKEKTKVSRLTRSSVRQSQF